MKNAYKFFSPLFLALLIIIGGCGKDEGPSITSLSVRASINTAIVVGTKVTFTARDQNNTEVTDLVEFLVDNSPISGNEYTTTEAGEVDVTARLGGVTSSPLKLNVIVSVTSIDIVADKSSIKPIGTDVAMITAKNQDGDDINSLVRFYVNNSINPTDEEVTSSSIGMLEVKATYDGIESNVINITSELNVTALTLQADRTNVPADGYTKAVLEVLDQDQDNIIDFVDVQVNGSPYTANTFFSKIVGTYDVTATFESVQSNSIQVTVDPFTVRKVLIEEFTGEWCGWCPQAAYNLDELVKEHPYVLTVGIHNGDGLAYTNEATIRNAFGLNYFPSGLVGRVNLGSNVGFNGPTLDPKVVEEVNKQIYDETVMAGVSINSSHDNSTATIDVQISFYETVNDPVAVTIYIMEDNVIGGNQQNYFSGRSGYEGTYYYSLPPSIPSYNHKYVLRTAATDIYGETVPAANAVQNGVHVLDTKQVDISSYDANNCYVIAFVHYELGGAQKILNTQQVKLGESIGINQ